MKLQSLEEKARAESIPLMKREGMDFVCAYLHAHPEILHILEAGTAVGWSAIRMASVRENIFCHHTDALNYRTIKYYDLFFIDAAKAQYQRIVRHFLSYGYSGSVWIFDNLCFHGMVDNPALSNNRGTRQMMHKIHAFRKWLSESRYFVTEFYPEIGDGIAVARQIQSGESKGQR